MERIFLWLVVGFWVAVIYYFGRAGFGRANTQALIDKCKKYPHLWGFLDRNHGKIRASFHYFEFGLCYLILFTALCGGRIEWHYARGFLVWLATGILAFLDEMHQKKSGGRCFRRIDLLHSILGATLVMLVLFRLG